MKIKELRNKPLWQMTGEEFLYLHQSQEIEQNEKNDFFEEPNKERKFVYGLGGIARLFGCSIPTASRIKQSGKINKAITQIGRKIIVDAELALELAGVKTGGRKVK